MLGLVLGLFLASFLLAQAGRSARHEVLPTDVRVEAEQQLVLVYIGKSTCSWCIRPSVLEAVVSLKDSLARTARARGFEFVAIGVALDRNFSEGSAFLDRMGPWNEISVGYGAANSTALRMLPTSGTPRLALFRRDLEQAGTADGGMVTSVTSEEMVAYKQGYYEILGWQQADGAVPAYVFETHE